MSINEKCCICMEKVLIPVEITCFPCHQDTNINCFSFQRVCLVCAHEYLELDKHVQDREFYKKCIYCPSVCCLHRQSKKNSYRIDFVSLIQDPLSCYFCPYCKYFCGNQLEIFHHLESCSDYFIECPCKQTLMKKDFSFHLFHCNHHLQCSICNDFVLKSKMKTHLQDEHDLCLCNMCTHYIEKTKFDQHISSQCPDRLVICSYCIQFVKYKNYHSHLSDHFQELKNEMQTYHENYHHIMEKFNKLRQLMNPYHRAIE